jgi:hypothetical protein
LQKNEIKIIIIIILDKIVRCRKETVQQFFEEVFDVELKERYFQQDRATPHCTRDTLNNALEDNF